MNITRTPLFLQRPKAAFAPFAKRALALVLAVAAPGLACAAAQRHYLELAVSPDGRHVAAVEGDGLPTGGQPVVRELIIRSADGQVESTVQLPCGAVPECWPSSPAWKHDSSQLSFALRTPGSHARTLFQVRPDGSGLQQLLAFDGTLEGLRYASNGTLAMLATAGATKEVGATEAGAPVTGDLNVATPTQRLAVLPAGGKQLQWVSRDGLFIYEYDWLPDGSGFVATAAPGDGDRNWWVAKLLAISAPSGAERVLYSPRNTAEQLAVPKVSPDGQRVAFIVGLMSDFGVTGGDIRTIGLKSGAAQDITPKIRASVTDIDWTCEGHLLATVQAGDQMQRVDFGSGKQAAAGHALWSDAVNLQALSTASGCAVKLEAAVIETFNRAPEIHIGNGNSWREFTHRNAALQNSAVVHSVQWRNEGHRLQGWLLMPPPGAVAAGGKLPLIVNIHGGPAGTARPRFINQGTMNQLLKRGYALFLPNPRGSQGQGDAFTKANVKDFGGGDLRDVMKGLDAVIKAWPIDGQRLGLTGHSYGGFMTMWAVTQTQRFKAAVAGAGIANWQSYYGQNGIAEWMTPYFGASVYANPAVYAKSSPINFITRVKTPTFSYVGEADIECPAPQTLEFGRALQMLGVPSSTVIYPGEGHGFRNPQTLADIEKRTLEWFDRYLSNAASKARP
jgi:dipeptidyl aminopeptidase/acylaminoacyl peptidase